MKESDTTESEGWVEEDRQRLLQQGSMKKSIIESYDKFRELMTNDHSEAEIVITQAIEVAQATDEVGWELFLRHWRLQLWLSQRQARRMLPEAVNLFTLASDERVGEIPEIICAYHDVAECYVEMDAAGYYEEIMENAQDILAQLPDRHRCATCARMHIARTAAATRRKDEARNWIKETRAKLNEKLYPELARTLAATHAELQQWDEALQGYKETRKLARREHNDTVYLAACLGLARVYLEKHDETHALEMLQDVRQKTKYSGGIAHFASWQEVEGLYAVTRGETTTACAYFIRAARLYLDLGCYNDAARLALATAHRLAESTDGAESTASLSEEILGIAAQAVGQLPASNQDKYAELAILGREALPPTENPMDAQITSTEQEEKELSVLQDLLTAQVGAGRRAESAMLLYRIGYWYATHENFPAAIEYLLLNAALERQLLLPLEEREAALSTLKHLQEIVSTDMIESTLAVLEQQAPAWLMPVLNQLSQAQWSWLMRALDQDLAGRPVIEPEPEPSEHDSSSHFALWLDHVTSMTMFVVRFQRRIEPAEYRSWLATLHKYAENVQTEIERQKAELTGDVHQQERSEAEGRAVLSLIHGLAELTRGEPAQEVQKKIVPPFEGVIEQMSIAPQQSIWQQQRHEAASARDFLAEQAAQEAVYGLRQDDEERSTRLANLALRFKLMALDQQKEQGQQEVIKFLRALSSLLRNEGRQPGETAERNRLAPPYDALLAAVYTEAQRTVAVTE